MSSGLFLNTDYIGLFFNISVSAGLLSLWFLMVSVIILKAHVMRPVWKKILFRTIHVKIEKFDNV